MTAPYTPMRPLRPRANNAIPDDEKEQRQQGGMRPANTFAGMQQRGVARPAPPPPSSYYRAPQPAAPAGSPATTATPQQRVASAPAAAPAPASAPATYATYTPPTDPNREALTNAVGQYLAQPSAYQSSDLQRDYKTLNDQLALDAQQGKRAIDETMAARGLHASTVTGDAYGALEKQQDVTRQQFANNYLDREASDLATARANAISAALGLQQENADESLAAFGANQAAQQQGHSQAMDVANLGLQTELGRGTLGVSQQQADTASAAQRATAENQTGTLQLGRDTLAANQGNQAADRALQEKLQGNELGFSREQLAAQTRDSDLDRALQQMLGVGNLDLQNRQLDSANVNAAADREQAGKLAADQLGLDYAKLSQDDKEFLANLDLSNRQLDATNSNAAADRSQQLDIAKMQDTRAGQSIDASRQAANAQAVFQALTIASQLGLPKDGIQGLVDAIMGGKFAAPSPDQTNTSTTNTNTNQPTGNDGEIYRDDPAADPREMKDLTPEERARLARSGSLRYL